MYICLEILKGIYTCIYNVHIEQEYIYGYINTDMALNSSDRLEQILKLHKINFTTFNTKQFLKLNKINCTTFNKKKNCFLFALRCLDKKRILTFFFEQFEKTVETMNVDVDQ